MAQPAAVLIVDLRHELLREELSRQDDALRRDCPHCRRQRGPQMQTYRQLFVACNGVLLREEQEVDLRRRA